MDSFQIDSSAMMIFYDAKSFRAVTFSEYSELVAFPCDHYTATTWYSSKETRQFRQTMIDDARKASQEIMDLPHGGILSHEQLTQCLGIKIFRTHGVAKCTGVQARRAHIAAVLSEQLMQKQMGICDVERLSRVSQNTSHASVLDAQKLAVGYAALLIE